MISRSLQPGFTWAHGAQWDQWPPWAKGLTGPGPNQPKITTFYEIPNVQILLGILSCHENVLDHPRFPFFSILDCPRITMFPFCHWNPCSPVGPLGTIGPSGSLRNHPEKWRMSRILSVQNDFKKFSTWLYMGPWRPMGLMGHMGSRAHGPRTQSAQNHKILLNPECPDSPGNPQLS